MARALLLGVVVGATAGCGGAGGLPQVRDGAELALRRGSAWSTYTVRPPHVIGANGNLRLERGRLTGAIAGRQVNVLIEPDGLTGFAGGNVELEITPRRDSVEIHGLWGNGRVRLTVTPERLDGTIRALSGVGQCQYVLDRLNQDGHRVGMSICTGLAEETLLEIPKELLAWLKNNELAALLLVLLSAPPLTTMEMASPVF